MNKENRQPKTTPVDTVKPLVLFCEHCGKEIATIKEGSKHDIAARAKHAGVWVKNFMLLHDWSGYHYFCDTVCDHAWRKTHLAKDKSTD